MAHNIINTGVPHNIHSALIKTYPYRTRQATNGDIRTEIKSDKQLPQTFKYQARSLYNQIPVEIRQCKKKLFKKKLKKWVKENIPLR